MGTSNSHNNQASFVKQFLGDSSFFLSKQWCGIIQGRLVQVIAVVKQRTGETEIVLTSSLNTTGSSGWWGVRSVAPHALSLLGEVVQGPHEVQHLHHVQPAHAQA